MAKDKELWKKANFNSELRDEIATNIIADKDVKTAINYVKKYPEYTNVMFELLRKFGTASNVVKWINTIGVNDYSNDLVPLFLAKIKGNNSKDNNISVLMSLAEVLYNNYVDDKTSKTNKIIISDMLYNLMDVVIKANGSKVLFKWMELLGNTEFVNNDKFINYIVNFYRTWSYSNRYIKMEFINFIMSDNKYDYVKSLKVMFIADGYVDDFMALVKENFSLRYPNYSEEDFYEGLSEEYKLNIVI